MEMEGRQDEGIEFMSKTVENWKVRFFSCSTCALNFWTREISGFFVCNVCWTCVINELRNRLRSPQSLYGSAVEHRSAESIGLRFDSSLGLRIFFFVPRSWQDEKHLSLFLNYDIVQVVIVTRSMFFIIWPALRVFGLSQFLALGFILYWEGMFAVKVKKWHVMMNTMSFKWEKVSLTSKDTAQRIDSIYSWSDSEGQIRNYLARSDR